MGTGITGGLRKIGDGPRADADSCSPEGFKGYTGITCEEHSQMEARHWLNASLPCASPEWSSDMDYCYYSVWAFVAMPESIGTQERCAYDGFRAVTQDWMNGKDGWQ